MIKLTLSNEKIKNFNLKSFDREKSLYNAWYSMQGDSKFDDKKIKITTDKNETLELKISEIKDCQFDECEHVEVKVLDEKNKKQTKKEKPKDELSDFMSRLNKGQEEREKLNIAIFLKELKKTNTRIDMSDPMLLQILESVKKDRYGPAKIPFYANIYRNMSKKR